MQIFFNWLSWTAQQIQFCFEQQGRTVKRMQFFLEWLSRKIEHMSFSFEWVNGCDFFHALDGMGRQQKQKKSDRHYSSTCVASRHLSESNGSDLPCAGGCKKIYQLLKPRGCQVFAKPFSVFKMKIKSQNNYLSGAIVAQSRVCFEKYSLFCWIPTIISVSFE